MFLCFLLPFHIASYLKCDWTEIRTVEMHMMFYYTGASLIVKTPYFLLNLTHFKCFIALSHSQQIRARNLKEKTFARILSSLERSPPPPRRPYVANLCQAVKH